MLLLYNGGHLDSNFYYHSGCDVDHCFLLVSGKAKTLFVPKMNESLAKTCFRGNVVVYEDALKTLAPYLRRKTVLADFHSLNAGMAKKLSGYCRLKDHSLELLKMRMVKRKDEVANIAKAARYTHQIFDSLDFKKAQTELGLKKQILIATLDLGLEPAFEPIISTDKNTSYPHSVPTNKKLGSLVMVDYGVKYNHYCSDVTRCFIRDGDSRKHAEYEKLQYICYSLIESLHEMESGRNVANACERLMVRAGFPKMIHSPGHGVGLDIHELPSLRLKSEDKLAGTVMAIEPAFYLKNYGMRYEETVYFDGKKSRIF
ncbi:aminopeptidase P family protein [Candidatus Micrarchaeota archaeon]|nr:aminopeptidase P family protein [Candidatus Micrarchaeota archaeon]